MALGTAAALAGGALVGGIAGSMKDSTTQSNTSGINLNPASALETQATNALGNALSDYANMVNAGPGQRDVTNAYTNTQSLAALLSQYANGGYMPTSADTATANSLGAQLFQGQQTALNQSFQTQNQQAAQQAALMGRDINDPVLRAKLAYQQTQAQQQLSANQGTWSTQYALSMPQQKLAYAQQQNGLLNGLATQAMQNRQALMSMGSGIMNDERQFRLNTGTRWGNQTVSSGGGLGGALNGAIAGLGSGMRMASSMGGIGTTGAGGASAMSGASNPFGYATSGSFASSPMFAGSGYGGGYYG